MVRKIIDDVFDEDLKAIDGTLDWYSFRYGKELAFDLYDTYDRFQETGFSYGCSHTLVKFPECTIYRPIELRENVYTDVPVFYNDTFYFISADFLRQELQILSISADLKEQKCIANIPFSEIKDFYNLKLILTPLTLIREGDGMDIIWPERKQINCGVREGIYFRDGSDLYCYDSEEDSNMNEIDYVLVRDIQTGEIKERFKGSICGMPNGDAWILKPPSYTI